VTLQALEIRALTYFPGKAPHHVEEGWIRFDANRYQQRDQFVIQEGWFQVQGETFRFDDKGDLLAVEDDLLVLGKPRLPSNRLGVHDVLGLLFDASLIATDTKNIRKGVTGVLRLTGQEPLHSETQAPLRGKPQVTADLYSVGKRTDKPVNYVICRSRSLPFDFYTVNLTLSLPESSFSITTALTNYEYSGTEPLLGNPQVFHGAALATSQKVKDKLRDPNVRVWRTAKDALFGEFAGTEESRTKGSRTAVFLQPDGTTALSDVKFLFLDELSKPDQDWVAAGRFWNDGKVRKRYPYVLRFGIENEWKVRRRSGTVEFDRLYGELDAADRKWIDRQEALRKR
jgi:hypothetical protein